MEALAQDTNKIDVEMMEDKRHLDVAAVGHLANQEAHDETPMQALRRHPWTCVWVVYGIWVLLCCSFDNSAAGSVVGIPRFRQDYGYAYEGDYVLPANWQSAYSGGPAAASVFGTFAGGYIADKIGRKWTVVTIYILLFIGITVETVSAQTSNPNAVFFAGKFINGFATGSLITTAMTYIGELSPLALRGIFTGAAAIAFTIGPFIQALITNFYGDLPSSWAYKSAFVAQYGVTGIGLLVWPFMPESPTWLLLQGKDDKAIRAFKRLGEKEEEIQKHVAHIKLTLEEARKETEGATYLECFKKSNLRRTIVSGMPLTLQAFCGVFFIAGYATYYFQLAGFSTEMSFRLAVCQQVLSMAGNVTAWFLIERVGRRPLTFWGLVVLTVILLVAGGLACVGQVGTNKATVGMIILYCYVYNVTLGATAYTSMAEIGTSRLRAKTAAIALLVQGCFSCMWQFVLPFMFNPNEANLQAKTSFIFGGFSVFCCIYAYYCHPETKGRSYEELDEMFQKGVSARDFGSYVTEAERKGQQVKQEVMDGTLAL
ncbi:hypothetical protein EHS25_007259 [Saitozyma podzolica]|uniref:Major facilitator superfamily (MFS) profile domain-containing protein n=1 Tax=Saitozyma podzolica TaxID=1890683 RepID=A0A427XN33_9TREE|nr:hypothetical protein EHS25_007259 [Saitozyma podzolica]